MLNLDAAGMNGKPIIFQVRNDYVILITCLIYNSSMNRHFDHSRDTPIQQHELKIEIKKNHLGAEVFISIIDHEVFETIVHMHLKETMEDIK